MSDKTCGECRFLLPEHDGHGRGKCYFNNNRYLPSCGACKAFVERYSGNRPTNGDVIRQCSNRELAEISVYEDTMSEGEIIYRSTLIVDKFFLTKNCAVAVVVAWLNAPVESEGKNERQKS